MPQRPLRDRRPCATETGPAEFASRRRDAAGNPSKEITGMQRSALVALLCSGTVAIAACSSPAVTGTEGVTTDAAGGGSGSGGGDDAGGGLGGDTGSTHDGSSGSGGSSGGSDSGKPHDAAAVDVVEAGPFIPAQHPAWPQIPANAGEILHPMKLVTVVSTGDPQASTLFAFGDALVASQWWGSFATEYGLGTPQQTTVHVTGPAITANPDQSTMEQYIASAIQGNTAAAPDGNTMYMLYLPPGIDIVDTQGPNTNCQYYGGYHTSYGTGGDGWGVGQHCPLTGTGLTDIQWMTIVGSHEVVEAATDPVPGNGYSPASPDTQSPWTQPPWEAALYGEVGDMCVSTQVTEGSFTYQRIWSNVAAAKGGDPCVPPFSKYAYVNASAPQGWYTVTAGGSVQIPVTGFSDRATEDWVVAAQMWTSSGSTFTASVTSATTLHTDAGDYATTNNGKQSTLTVTAPVGVASGTWASIGIYSIPTVYSGDDPYHLWFVGVYVP
jgi:hypothetical protein